MYDGIRSLYRHTRHDVFRDLLADMLRQCGFKKIETEPKNWDYRLTNNDGEGADRKRPDIICHDPRSNTKQVHHRLESHYWRVQQLLHGEACSGEGEMETIRCLMG